MKRPSHARRGFAIVVACLFAVLLLALWALVFQELKTTLTIQGAQSSNDAKQLQYNEAQIAAVDLLESLPDGPQLPQPPPLVYYYPSDDITSLDNSKKYYKVILDKQQDVVTAVWYWTIQTSAYATTADASTDITTYNIPKMPPTFQ